MKSLKILQIVFLAFLWNINNTYAFKPINCIQGSSVLLQEDTIATGNWLGTSICQQKNSNCHDENAYYHISGTGNPLIYEVTGYKILDNHKVNMGTLNFNYDISSHILSCTTPNGKWTLMIKGNNIEGELRTHDNILFRKILLTKV